MPWGATHSANGTRSTAPTLYLQCHSLAAIGYFILFYLFSHSVRRNPALSFPSHGAGIEQEAKKEKKNLALNVSQSRAFESHIDLPPWTPQITSSSLLYRAMIRVKKTARWSAIITEINNVVKVYSSPSRSTISSWPWSPWM